MVRSFVVVVPWRPYSWAMICHKLSLILFEVRAVFASSQVLAIHLVNTYCPLPCPWHREIFPSRLWSAGLRPTPPACSCLNLLRNYSTVLRIWSRGQSLVGFRVQSAWFVLCALSISFWIICRKFLFLTWLCPRHLCWSLPYAMLLGTALD